MPAEDSHRRKPEQGKPLSSATFITRLVMRNTGEIPVLCELDVSIAHSWLQFRIRHESARKMET
jgi:hypothetical protein